MAYDKTATIPAPRAQRIFQKAKNFICTFIEIFYDRTGSPFGLKPFPMPGPVTPVPFSVCRQPGNMLPVVLKSGKSPCPDAELPDELFMAGIKIRMFTLLRKQFRDIFKLLSDGFRINLVSTLLPLQESGTRDLQDENSIFIEFTHQSVLPALLYIFSIHKICSY